MQDSGPAYLMLAHDGLARAARLAARLGAHGAPVAVHVDARADLSPFRAALPPGAAPLMVPRRRADWGRFGLVQATLDGLAALLASGRPFSHVALLSGADLQLRPEAELRGFLAAHPGVDFIESVDPRVAEWGRGGLTHQRFEWLFPLDWRRRRRAFDALCALQRRTGFRRALPAVSPPMQPRLGLQWWCLSRGSVEALLADPDLPRLCRWFRLSWLPDESFFATLVPRVSAAPPDRRGPLTFQRFDATGKPWLLYDDHIGGLAAGDFFFARKAWPGATLDAAFPRPKGHARFAATPPALPFAAIEARALHPPRGLRHAGRAPLLRTEGLAATPRPWKALVGLDAPWGAAILDWLNARADIAPHGRIFADPPGRFAGGAQVGPGGMVVTRALLCTAPERLLSTLVSAPDARIPALALDPRDAPSVVAAAGGDPMAHLLVLRDAWALGEAAPDPETARRAVAAERALLDRASPARLTLIDPWRLLAAPGPTLRAALAGAGIGLPRDDGADPPPIPHALALRPRLARLRAEGFDVTPPP
ncbi:beta-1,6-N-acetylglucosaminyltransferase [Rhodovulum sp. DZ06]|uniref:beta-1,6-N-acetylglucosaminyltransferase n=1 Tax=Rhodovulum sp. DZ06 TaxID=3425126 RepID=UPI003D343083